jgi:hypothetical protein
LDTDFTDRHGGSEAPSAWTVHGPVGRPALVQAGGLRFRVYLRVKVGSAEAGTPCP